MPDKKPIAAGKSSFELTDPEILFAALPMEKESVILDAACGSGAYTLALAARVPRGTVFAVDLWEEGIARLRLSSGDAGFDNIVPMVADLGVKIPIEKGSVDICLMAAVLHDLVQDGTDQGALREIIKVLKPDGLLAVIEFKKISGPPGPPVDIRLSPEALNAMLAPHGLTPVWDQAVDLGEYNYLSLYRLA